MRALRSAAGMLVWLLASVLLLLAVVLCLTVLLLPVGLALGSVAVRLYALGLRLVLPRGRGLEKGVRKQSRRWRTSARRSMRGLRKR